MPLTAATTDLFQKVGLPGSATTLASPGYTIGNTGVTVGSTTNHPTDTLYTFAIDRAQTVNGVTSRIAGTYCEFEGIVASGTTIASLVLKYGTSQNYPAGSFTRVYIPVSSNRENQLIIGLRQDHNGKGNHQTLTDDNGNPWLTRAQVAAAVNSIQAANAATGGTPRLDAIGSDTNVPLYIGAKGSGVVVAENPELIVNFVASGGAIAISSGLIGTFSNAVFYSNGKRYQKTSVPNKTYTINKDTYVDVDPTNGSAATYTEVANGAASPALTTNYVRVGKVVTNGTAIASIQQYGYDSLNNFIYPESGSSIQPIIFGGTGGTIAFTVPFDCVVEVVHSRAAWGFGGAAFGVFIALSSGTLNKVAETRSYVTGSDTVGRQMVETAIFNGATKNSSYTLTLTPWVGSGGGSVASSEYWQVKCSPIR